MKSISLTDVRDWYQLRAVENKL